ncbi:MAG: OmpA family protein [Hyphomicrobiaceae bacterium]
MSQGVNKLKELLFEPESRAIADFSHRLDQVFERAGSDDKLEQSISKVLDGALRTAEVTQHEELSDALAPLVIKTIRTEIFSSRDALVEAIHPMTGRIVKQYVASAMKDLSDQVNRKMAANPMMIALQVITSGQSPGKIALANSQPLEIEEIYLIRRGSGELLARWPENANSANKDQVMSGVLTAITEFANDAFAKDDASLRQIDMGGTQLYLRASPSYMLAAKCSGVAPKAVEKIIDEAFLNAIEQHDHVLTAAAQGRVSLGHDQAMKTFADDFEHQVSQRQTELRGSVRKGLSPFVILLSLIGLPLLASFGWTQYVAYETNRVQSIAAAIINDSSEIRGYPTRLKVSSLGKTVTVEGLAPSTRAHVEVRDRLQTALPSSKIVDNFSVLSASGPDLSPEIYSVRRDFAALHSRLSQDALVRATNWADRRIADGQATLGQLDTSSLSGDASIQSVNEATNIVDSVAQAMTELRKKLTKPVKTDVELEALRPTISEATTQLRRATASLQNLLGSKATPSPDGTKSTDNTSTSDIGSQTIVVAAEDLAIQAERLATVVAAVNQVTRIPKATPVAKPTPVSVTPRQRLVNWARDHAVFFTSDTSYRSPVQAEEDLDQLAALAKNTTELIRIVGYTDDRGGSNKNTSLSQARAGKVRRALISRGIDPARLIAVGRKDGRDLSPSTGEGSPNRRVEFEIGFANERAS